MKKIRYVLTLALIFLMFTAAELIKNEDVIFPGIIMLLTGLICTDKLPWKTDNIHTVILMTLSAAAGFAISVYVPFPLYIKLLAGFAACAIFIILSDCQLIPCLSACLIPIYTGITSRAYVVSVFILTLTVVIMRIILINTGNKEASFKFHYTPDFGYDIKLWGRMFIIFAIFTLIPTVVFDAFMKYLPLVSDYLAAFSSAEALFLAAPTLAVTLAEGCLRSLKGRRFRIWFVITVASVIGALTKFMGVDLLGLPMCIPALIAAAVTLAEMNLMNIMFAPIGAAALLPFVLDGNVFWYPPIMSAGCLIILIISSSFRKKYE